MSGQRSVRLPNEDGEMGMRLPIVAKCTRCGREFVTPPSGPPPWRDPYFPADQPAPAAWRFPLPQGSECDGEVVLIDARHERASE